MSSLLLQARPSCPPQLSSQVYLTVEWQDGTELPTMSARGKLRLVKMMPSSSLSQEQLSRTRLLAETKLRVSTAEGHVPLSMSGMRKSAKMQQPSNNHPEHHTSSAVVQEAPTTRFFNSMVVVQCPSSISMLKISAKLCAIAVTAPTTEVLDEALSTASLQRVVASLLVSTQTLETLHLWITRVLFPPSMVIVIPVRNQEVSQRRLVLALLLSALRAMWLPAVRRLRLRLRMTS